MSRWVVGADIGGTNLVVGLVSEDGSNVRGLETRPTLPERGADAVVADVVAMATDAANEMVAEGGDAPVGVGVGCPGPLDREAGVVTLTPNLGWRDFPVRDRVATALGLPVSLDNDANCATYGEWWKGAASGADSVVGITLGTGVGGGVVLGGKILRGVSGSAGEIGHTTVEPGGRKCPCGSRGCLEAYASGPAIVASARAGLLAGRSSRLRELGDFGAEDVFRESAQGDDFARSVVHRTAGFLGVGVANAVNLINPEVVVILGGVAGSWDQIIGPLLDEVRRRAFAVAHGACRLVPGELGSAAGVVGAAGVFLTEGGVGP